MIVFDLECLNGHTFEGWFEDREDLSRQLEQGRIVCPVCDTASVSPKLSAVAIKTSSSASVRCAAQRGAQQASQELLAEFTEKVADYVEKNFENVGNSFATEALKMHYGATEFRNIRGTTTREEEKQLKEEGVPVMKVPVRNTGNEDLN